MKDPAFLFYSSDFISGTFTMTDEQIGKYIRLMCFQHLNGHLSEKDMLSICKAYDEDVLSHFKKDEEGKYFNQRLDNEINRRKAFTESRRSNANHPKKKEAQAEHMQEHMGTETETTNSTIVITEEEKEFKKFEEWILKNAASVSKMKEPFTIEQYKTVKEKFKSNVVKELLSSMHNHKPLLTKNVSAYLTLTSWIARRNETQAKETPTEQKLPARLIKLG